jgi:hypothetical protein
MRCAQAIGAPNPMRNPTSRQGFEIAIPVLILGISI